MAWLLMVVTWVVTPGFPQALQVWLVCDVCAAAMLTLYYVDSYEDFLVAAFVGPRQPALHIYLVTWRSPLALEMSVFLYYEELVRSCHLLLRVKVAQSWYQRSDCEATSCGEI